MPKAEGILENFAINLDFLLIGFLKSIYRQEIDWQADWISTEKPLLRQRRGFSILIYLPMTRLDILNIGRITLIAIKPTNSRITTIIIGSIIDTVVFMTVFNSRA